MKGCNLLQRFVNPAAVCILTWILFNDPVLSVPIKKNEKIYHFRTRCHCVLTWKRSSAEVLTPQELVAGQAYTRPDKIVIAPRAMMYRERKLMHPIYEGLIKPDKFGKKANGTSGDTPKDTSDEKQNDPKNDKATEEAKNVPNDKATDKAKNVPSDKATDKAKNVPIDKATDKAKNAPQKDKPSGE